MHISLDSPFLTNTSNGRRRLSLNIKPQHPWVHPLELRHTYRLLSTLPLAHKTATEVEELTDRLANARSVLELNRFIRQQRVDENKNNSSA